MFVVFSLLALLVVQAQTAPVDRPGLELVRLSFEKKLIEREEFSGGMVSNKPPVLDNSTIMLPEGSPRNENPLITDRKAGQQAGKLTDIKKDRPNPIYPRVWVYAFEAEVKNIAAKPITRFVWAYQLPESATNGDGRKQQYLCNVRLEPGETRRIKVNSPIPQSKVVDASGAATPPAAHEPALKDMIIEQIQFADQDIWQRPNWDPIVLTRQGAKKLGRGKCIAL